jgi:hypothetical protein
MRALVTGAPERAGQLADSLRAADLEAVADDVRQEAPESEIAALAQELVRLEEVLLERQPAAVLLVGAGDRCLAAALVAIKLLIPVAAVGLDDATGENAMLLAQLVDRKLSADAGEIAAWMRGLPTLR